MHMQPGIIFNLMNMSSQGQIIRALIQYNDDILSV